MIRLKLLLSYLLVFSCTFLLQSCTSEKELAASIDDVNNSFSGPSYPTASYDDDTFLFNLFCAWLIDISSLGDLDINSKKQISNWDAMVKLQFIEKGSKVGNTGSTHLAYIELPLYALYQYPLQSGARLFGGIGPYIGYGLFGKSKSTFGGQTTSVEAFSSTGFRRFDAGLAIVLGYKTESHIGFSLGYERGLANIGPSNAGGDKVKNRVFSFNVSYDLDKLIKNK